MFIFFFFWYFFSVIENCSGFIFYIYLLQIQNKLITIIKTIEIQLNTAITKIETITDTTIIISIIEQIIETDSETVIDIVIYQ